jgi:nitroimidazol reductase NimA-like FMN-containing flavoprotein (pyridoxamine 5'-phosphate oxidase superfamily)
MIGQMGLFVEPNADIGSQPFDLYVHGHVSSRLMALPNEDDLPVCVAATILDGIVLALSPFNNSCNYRSVILYGNATIVTDEAERLYAMQLITNGLVPNRWENSRIPPTKVELDQTQILKITLCSASAKVRTSGPTYDRRDLKDKSLCGTVWSGVVPVQQRLGSPKAGDKNEIAFPDYLHHWRQEINSRGNRILI